MRQVKISIHPYTMCSNINSNQSQTDERECGDSAEGPQLPEVQGALPLRHEGPGARPDRGDRDAAGDNHWGE